MPEKPASQPEPAKMILDKTKFGTLADGREVSLFTCTNAKGLTLKVMDYGATVVALEKSDRNGIRDNLVLAFDTLDPYLQRHPYFGSTVGRYGNRIAGGKFMLDGRQFTLAANDGPNHLHGGDRGFDRVLWQARPIKTADSVGVNFIYNSPDGEEGYPGNLRVSATYEINNDNELVITFAATTDQPTPINLTNHCYWNLGGAGKNSVLEHELTINADKYLPVDNTLIPTGELAAVAGTPFDFREPKTIGSRIAQLESKPIGYDHCYVLNSDNGQMHFAALLRDAKSGRVMEVHTTQPGLQLYSGNFLDGSGACGGFPQYAAVCLEAQHLPDSPNRPNFPNTILHPGENYREVTVHKFRVE